MLLDVAGYWDSGVTCAVKVFQLARADICLRTAHSGRSCLDQQLIGEGPAALLPVDGHGQASPMKGLQV